MFFQFRLVTASVVVEYQRRMELVFPPFPVSCLPPPCFRGSFLLVAEFSICPEVRCRQFLRFPPPSPVLTSFQAVRPRMPGPASCVGRLEAEASIFFSEIWALVRTLSSSQPRCPNPRLPLVHFALSLSAVFVLATSLLTKCQRRSGYRTGSFFLLFAVPPPHFHISHARVDTSLSVPRFGRPVRC